MQYPNAGSGLKKLFIAQIGSVICTVLLVIPLINIVALTAGILYITFLYRSSDAL